MARVTYKIYHVVHERGRWAVEGEHSKRSSSRHDTKDQAVERGRELARSRKGQLKIHKMDGTLETEYTYGHDPRNIPG